MKRVSPLTRLVGHAWRSWNRFLQASQAYDSHYNQRQANEPADIARLFHEDHANQHDSRCSKACPDGVNGANWEVAAGERHEGKARQHDGKGAEDQGPIFGPVGETLRQIKAEWPAHLARRRQEKIDPCHDGKGKVAGNDRQGPLE
jgi:hypothetical protein